MKLTINGVKQTVLPISKLSFNSFNTILVKNKVLDLKEYIALYVDMPIDDLMNAKISTVSMPALHASIFDIDFQERVKKYPDTFEYGNHIHILKEMTLSTFGQNYIFDLYYQQYRADKINLYELSMYAISCCLTNSYDTTDIQNCYDDLCKMDWVKVLPTAFFLAKKFWKKKKGSWMLSLVYMSELKKMKRLSSYKMIKYKSLVKKLLPSYW